MNSLANKRICVLGAGVVGLSCAYRLVELNNCNQKLDITIIAKEFGKETTSDGAGGLFRPDERFIPGVSREISRQWSTDSFKRFNDILFSSDGGKAGIFQVSGYQVFNEAREDPTYKDIVYQFRHLKDDELNMFGERYNYGYFCTTLCVDVRPYMKYLTDFLILNGVKFVRKEISNLQSFIENNNYDIVFNCVGMGALTVCNDTKMVPIRGQMFRVRAPWVKHFYYTDDNCYIIPNLETVCLGGTRQVGDSRVEVDEKDSKGIYERCLKLCPSLKNATVQWEWAGLRPLREPLRIEKEIINKKNGSSTTVIHNYGHGGNGISLSWGTAVHAVKLLIANSSKL